MRRTDKDTGERRRFTRVALELKAVLVDPVRKQRYSTPLVDISLKGAMLVRPPELQVATGYPCILEIAQPKQRILVRMEGTLVRVDQMSVGFCWDVIDGSSMDDLRRLLATQLSDPGLMEREVIELVRVADQDKPDHQ